MKLMRMNVRKLALLMWKHYHLRKHHWFLTTLEIVLPILFVGGLIRAGDTFLNSDGMTRENATIFHSLKATEILKFPVKFQQLIYMPDTNDNRKIVEDALKIWGIPGINVQAVNNEADLERLLIANSSDFYTGQAVGVVFVNTANSEQFVYKIRDADNWDTEKLFEKDIDGPYRENPYLNQGFVALQLALNAAFLRSKNNDVYNDYSSVSFQSFPYPEYNKENDFRSFVPHAVCIVVIITLLILSIPLITAVIEEKESGVKELMKIVGVQEWLLWTSWFLNALFFSLISFTVITYLLQYEFFGPHSAVIRHVYPSVLWSCIMLFCTANITFSFMFTALFHKPTTAVTVFFLVVTVAAYGSFWVNEVHSRYLTRLTCVFPVGAFIQGFLRIKYFEIHDLPLSWSSLNSLEKNTDGISLGFSFFMLIFDIILYLFLTYYITAINPGKFGVRKSPLFIFEGLKYRTMAVILKEEYLRSRFADSASEELVNLEDPPTDTHIEKVPNNLPISIAINDLHKNFGSVHVLKGVKLNIYNGEITALLGHNGAGKTTTMGILTGLVKPTAGTITYKNDMNVLKRMNEFRNNLGMCPQEDRLFSYLSVKNHLLFFGMLKGASRKEALQEANYYMGLMEINSKANSLTSDLSGGMKRKLCLSIALMGKAETLILDEPTSGLDVESRRKLWDLLLEMRGNRTIILTTHHMEEADALGDRIAIMHHGTIVAHGTSLYLKKAYQTGYHLTVTKHQNSSVEEITKIIETEAGVEGVATNVSSPTEVIYKLPLTETGKFSKMFSIVEARKDALGIENMGISCTTMEQVFLKVGGESVFDKNGSSRKFNKSGISIKSSTVTDGAALAQFAEHKKIGLSLILQQIRALIKKKALYTIRNIMTLFYRVGLVTLILVFMLKRPLDYESGDIPIELSLKTYPNAKIMLQQRSKSGYYKPLKEYAKKSGAEVVYTPESSIITALLNEGRYNLSWYKSNLIFAAEFNDSSTVFLNNPFALHSLPIAINMFSNLQLQTKDPSSSASITLINQPVKPMKSECSQDVSQVVLLSLWFWALAFFSVDLNTYFTMLLNVERIDGFKHIQFMSSVSPLTYWLSNFIFDFSFFFVILMGRLIVFKIFDDYYAFLEIDRHFAILLLVLTLFIGSSLLFTYVLSFMSRSKEGSYTLLFIFNIIGTVVVGVIYSFQLLIDTSKMDFSFWVITFYVTKYMILLVPPLNYFLMFIKFFNTWYFNTTCDRCPPPGLTLPPCPKRPYLVFSSSEHPNGILLEVLFSVFNLFFYSSLLAIIQLGYFDRFMNHIAVRLFGNTVSTNVKSGDNDVNMEKIKVERAVNDLSEYAGMRKCKSDTSRHPRCSNADMDELDPLTRGHTTDSVLVAHGLKKNYITWFHPFTAVADVNFMVKTSECFGLLGVNGAGKSTTFKMLTGDLLPTNGDASILGLKLSQNKTEYLSKAGYCAQSNCFLEQLSGREMLSLIASLRGIRSNQVKNMVDKWLSILGLEEYQNQHCGDYSGGNKRKLCTAMSLIGNPHVVFLDEPTSGVDPVSRRRLYTVMDQTKASGQAVILTSHSMEECENLCDRLTILAKGRMQCIGTAQHLKKTYAQGFSVLIKIPETISEGALARLKTRIQEQFENHCILKDEHRTQLYYQITNVNIPWSLLFGRMEKLKNEDEHIVDYILGDTSLEEVFISFAKQSSSKA